MCLHPINNASAVNNGKLYKYCKDFASRSFNGETPEDVACVNYVAGIIDLSSFFCDAAMISPDNIAKTLMPVFSKASRTDIDAVIQAYVNLAAQHPEDWQYDPSYTVLEAAKKIAACE